MALLSAAAAAAFSLTVSGKITSIDHGDGSFTMHTGLPVPAAFRISRTTEIADGPQPLAFEALTPGDVVTVDYVAGDSERVAQSIRVKSKAREPSPAPRP